MLHFSNLTTDAHYASLIYQRTQTTKHITRDTVSALMGSTSVSRSCEEFAEGLCCYKTFSGKDIFWKWPPRQKPVQHINSCQRGFSGKQIQKNMFSCRFGHREKNVVCTEICKEPEMTLTVYSCQVMFSGVVLRWAA